MREAADEDPHKVRARSSIWPVTLAVIAAGTLVPASAGSLRRVEAARTVVEAPTFPSPAPTQPEATPPRAPRPVVGLPIRPLYWAGSSGEPRGKPARGRELILTFDDGPDLTGTPVVLAELERRGLRAIFFINGQHMVGSRPDDFARRDLVRKIAASGHLVANHTLSHRNVCSEPETIEQEIDGNAEIIAGATGLRPLMFRAPYGARCRRLDQALAERDLLSVGWNLDPQEWKGGSEEAIFEYLTSRLRRFHGRAVLLLHDTKLQAVRALPRILDWVESENARLAGSGGAPIAIRDYSVFLPAPPLPATGLATITDSLQTALAGPIAAFAPALR